MASSLAAARAPKNGLFQRLKKSIKYIERREFKRVSTTSLRGVPAILAIIATGMTIFGCIMVLSASSVEMIAQGSSPFMQVIRQIVFGLMGLVFMTLASFVPVQLYRNKLFLNFAMFLVIVAQVAVLVVGVEVNGNRNWLMIGGIQIQPSEIAKLVSILWMALMLKNQGDISVGVRRAIFPVALGIFPLFVLIYLGHDVGTLLVYGAIVFVMLWVGGLNKRATAWFLVLGVVAATLAMLSSENRRARVLALFGICNGSVCDQSNAGLAALASGGFWGVGLGRSRQKYNYLPEAHNDYIFAVIGEELGLIGSVLVILFYLGLIYCAVRIITRSADRFIKLATTGILTWLAFQALINVMMVVGLAPVIGVPLPFISYGGSSLISSMAAAGVLIGFARLTPLQSIAGGIDALETDKPLYKDTERRMPLAKIVNAENREFRKKNWEPSFDIYDYLKVPSIPFLGINVAEENPAKPATRRPAQPRNRRSPQPARRRPTPAQNREASPQRVKVVPDAEPNTFEEVTVTQAPVKQPVLRVVADVVEEQPQQAEVQEPQASEAESAVPEPVEVSQESAPVQERKLPPGLVSLTQMRKQRREAEKRN